MADMRRQQGGGDDGGGKDGKKKGATAFVGSGQNVIGRPTASDDDDDDESGIGSKGVIDRIFKHEGVDPGAATVKVVITFYRNGFTVDDGELRKLDDPANQAFLTDMNNGRVPRELQGRGPPGDLDVSVTDKRSEDYVPPAYRAFAGAGATVGRAVVPSGAVVRSGSRSTGPPVVDAATPTTTIAVRLISGKRERVVLNLTHTVGDLQAVVAGFGGPSGPAFVLHTGFPPKPLDDSSATIEAAGLKGAAVTQVAV